MCDFLGGGGRDCFTSLVLLMCRNAANIHVINFCALLTLPLALTNCCSFSSHAGIPQRLCTHTVYKISV